MLITRQEILKGRDAEYPLNPQMEGNLAELLKRLNQFRLLYGSPLYVNSGYRPGKYNIEAGGAPNSSHLTCEACDFRDSDGHLKRWIAENPGVLETCDLYMEHPDATPTWVHLQTRAPKSGSRVFRP